MRTFQTEETTFIYNSDFSGKIIIRNNENHEISINGKDIVYLVVKELIEPAIINNIISQLPEQLLKQVEQSNKT